MEWDEQEPVAVLDNGFGIYRLLTENDRRLHVTHCTTHCVAGYQWEGYFEQGLQLYTIRDRDGVSKGIINACEARRCIEHTAGDGYVAYARSRAGQLQHPVKFPNGENLVICELCPANSLGTREDHEDIVPVVEWLHTLEPAEGKLGEWNPSAQNSRTTAAEIRRELLMKEDA